VAGRIVARARRPAPALRTAAARGYDPPVAESRDSAAPRRERLRGRGSLPVFVHGVVEYGLGVLAIAAPFLFGFDDNAAVAFSVLLGAGMIVLGGVTRIPTGIVRSLPVDSHVVLDVVLGVAAIAGPFLFGFSGDTPATVFLVLLGAGYLLLAFMTRYHPGPRP
jgi:hypothetical protein